MAADYPSRIDICPWGFWEHNVGGWSMTRSQSNALLGGGRARQATAAINNEIGWKVLLKAGTWKFTMAHYTDAAVGIYNVKLDSTSLGTIDGYSSPAVANVVSTIAGITVATAGVYTLKLVMGTKNASSSNYLFNTQHIVLQRTGA